MTHFASGRGRTCSMMKRAGTPSHSLSSFDQRVTQWMSERTVTRGRRRNSSHVHVISRWTFRCFGLVEREMTWTGEGVRRLPRVTVRSDIHCVTRWAKLDNEGGSV